MSDLTVTAAIQQLFDPETELRLEAIRSLGRAGRRLDLLEAIAEREQPTQETLTATFWLALHEPPQERTWLWRLGRLMLRLQRQEPELAEQAAELHIIALQNRGMLEEE